MMEDLRIYKEIEQLEGSLLELRVKAEAFKLNKDKVKPQTIYAGTEENVEFFKQIADAFGIDEKLYAIDLVDGEYEIIVKI